jgi:signal transduction histidine kinase
MDRFDGEALVGVLNDVCAEHSRVVPTESYLALPTQDDRLRAVTALQQKARWLEAEIARRRRAEERLQTALTSERSARETAEAALRERDEVRSSTAHELKTPLTSLLGNARLLLRRFTREGRLDPDRMAGRERRGRPSLNRPAPAAGPTKRWHRGDGPRRPCLHAGGTALRS